MKKINHKELELRLTVLAAILDNGMQMKSMELLRQRVMMAAANGRSTKMVKEMALSNSNRQVDLLTMASTFKVCAMGTELYIKWKKVCIVENSKTI
jgi:hypothetical protein